MKQISTSQLMAENEKRKERRERKELNYRPEEREGFERWAVERVKIKDKTTGMLVNMRLNRPQRRVLAALERQRRRGEPIRLIVLKSRQWGCSTLVQMYMAWIQLTQAEHWHSLVCAHVRDAAASIRGMYSVMLAHYPREADQEKQWKFHPFEGSTGVREIWPRGCRVTLASSHSPDAARSGDYAMAHLSEVAFWLKTGNHTPEQVVSSVCGSVAREPLTLVVMESTANGPNNFFAREWKRSVAGQSDKQAVFVPWYWLDKCSEEIREPIEQWRERLDDYECALWKRGCTLEQINWYHRKRLECVTHAQMMAEYPTTEAEAFSCSATPVFDPLLVNALLSNVYEPRHVGELSTDMQFVDSPAGGLKVWEFPDTKSEFLNRYMVTVDVGGSAPDSDWSVILVTASHPDGSLEVVAQWRGHTADHEQLAWMAERIARWYDRALLIVESNTLETHCGVESAAANFVLDKLARARANLYRRRVPGRVSATLESRYGFHTNVQTKGMALLHLMTMMRNGLLVERDADAVDEMRIYQKLPDGSEAAPPGSHDDMVMTRAIAAYVRQEFPLRRRAEW